MISNEQNEYEYRMENGYLSFIGAIAEDGLEWGKIHALHSWREKKMENTAMVYPKL